MTEFQPTLPAEGVFTDAELAFMEDSPPGLYPENQDSNFGFIIRKLFSDRVQELIGQQATLYAERFPNTANAYLDEWERAVGLPANPSTLTLGQRRQGVENRLKKGWFTRSRVREIVESFLTPTFGDPIMLSPAGVPFSSGGIPLYSGESSLVGLYRVYERIPANAYDVWIKNTVTPDIVGLTRELTRITPSGISFTIDNTHADVLNYSKRVINENPIAYWPLGDVIDYSGYAVPNLTANGGVTAGSVAAPGLLVGAAGSTNPATTFDGVNDYFSVAATAAITALPQITLEAQVKISAYPALSQHRMIISQPTRYISLVQATAGVYAWSFTVLVDGVQQYLYATRPVALNTTYHVAGTFDGITMRLYENGVLVASTVVGGAGLITADGNPVFIGAYTGPGHFMNGVIDEAAIYNRALSAAQILDHYNTGRDVIAY
jgi:hypothetical protein